MFQPRNDEYATDRREMAIGLCRRMRRDHVGDIMRQAWDKIPPACTQPHTFSCTGDDP